MKITKEEFKKMIISEVKEIAKQEGWINEFNSINECNCGCGECSTKETENGEETTTKVIAISLESPEAFEMVEPKEITEPLSESVRPQEVKKLAVELSRMQELLGLKNPLLGVK